jgi:uncharacterized membrane protein YbhN (UPF0104 family)
METKNTIFKEQVYAKYCLMAKEQMDKESLAKKQKKLSGWLLILWILLILITLFVYFLISGFNWQVFNELTEYGLTYWTVFGAVFLGLIFVLIVETRKPGMIQINEIFKKADELIKNKKKNLKATAEEIDLLDIKEDNEL